MNKLLSPGDPPPVIVTNPHSRCPVLLTCEHAGGAIPARLAGLGLAPEQFARLMAKAPHGDNFAALLARKLASKASATLVESTYHRIVTDVNRGSSEQLWSDSVDGIRVPVNQDLSAQEVRQRVEEIWSPFNLTLFEALRTHMRRHADGFVLSVHTYHENLKRGEEVYRDRPWHIGVLWDEPRDQPQTADSNRRLGEFYADYFEQPGKIIGRNEPYDLRGPNPSTGRMWQTTVQRLFNPAAMPSVMLEIRNDQLETDQQQEEMAAAIASTIPPALAIAGTR